MLPLLLAAAAWGLVKARVTEAPRTRWVTHENLVQSYTFGEFVRTSSRLTFGSPRGQHHTVEADPRQRSLASGVLTRGAGRPPFALVVGTEASIDLDVIEPADRLMILRLSSAYVDRPQSVTVSFNGEELGTTPLRRDGEIMQVRHEVPAALQQRGTNRVLLRFAGTEPVTLHDVPVELPLSARLQSCHFLRPGELEELPPAPDGGARPGLSGERGTGGETRRLVVPAGVSARVSVLLPTAERLSLRYQIEQVDTSLEVSLVTDDGRRTVLATADRRDVLPRSYVEDLAPWAGRVVQLDIYCREGQGVAELSSLAVQLSEGSASAPEVAHEFTLPASDADAAPSMLVVLLDAFARDRSSAFGADRDTTPVLQQLASRALVATQARAPASYTVASVGSLFTGLHPFVHGVVHGETPSGPERLSEDAPRLAGLLANAGYRTAAWITNPNASARHGFGQGFHSYEELFAQADLWDEGVDGVALAPRLSAFLSEVGSAPFLAWVHVFEPHAPWRSPDDLQAQFVAPYEGSASGDRVYLDAFRTGALDPAELDQRDVAHLGDLYAARLARADRVLGELLVALDRSGRGQDTVVLVLADHGEALLEHQRLEHGDDVHAEQVSVPFVLLGPGVPAGVLDRPVGLEDVMPTLLGLAGVPAPEGLDGLDLLARPPERDRPLLSRGYGSRPMLGLERGPWRLLYDTASRRMSLFDISRDPGELYDLSLERPITRAWLHAELCRLMASALGRSQRALPQGQGDPERLAVLRSLGYLGSGADGPAALTDESVLVALRLRLVRD